jgi:hypothetical protein
MTAIYTQLGLCELVVNKVAVFSSFGIQANKKRKRKRIQKKRKHGGPWQPEIRLNSNHMPVQMVVRKASCDYKEKA